MAIKVPNIRWWIAGMLFVAALLNYVDRNVLGLLADTIQKDLNISNQEYASIINYFLIAYTIANLLSGRIVDKLGVRLSLALFLAWWTIANACTGLARSLTQICGLRYMLGLGEAGCYTASPKAVSEWFPPSERAAAVGLYSSGGAVGATIAPILVALIAANFGWRWVFAVTPAVAILWLVLWFFLYKNRATHPHITEKERAYLDANLVKPAAVPQAAVPATGAAGGTKWGWSFDKGIVVALVVVAVLLTFVSFDVLLPRLIKAGLQGIAGSYAIPAFVAVAAGLALWIGGFQRMSPAQEKAPSEWGKVLREPLVWQLMLARLITDPVWYFFQFWFPKYLRNMRGMDQQGVSIMWLIFLMATVGFLLGGYLSGRLVRRGLAPPRARLWMMAASVCVAPILLLIPFIPKAEIAGNKLFLGCIPTEPTLVTVIAIAMIVAYAATSWLSNITSLVVDLVPQRILGTSFGVIAFGSALGGFFMNKTVAWLIDHRTYNECFYIMSVLYPVAFLLVWGLRKRPAQT